MKRKPKIGREDWEKRVKGYSFWAKPLKPLPPEAYHQHNLMQSMWNRLVFINRQYLEERNEFVRGKDPEVLKLEKELQEASELCRKIDRDYRLSKITGGLEKEILEERLRECQKERKKVWQKLKGLRGKIATKKNGYEWPDMDAIANELYYEYIGKGLHNSCAGEIKDSFIRARKSALKGIVRMPKFKEKDGEGNYLTDYMSFIVKYGSGGKPSLCKLSKKYNKGTIFWITENKDKKGAIFYWNFKGVVIPFKTVIHRSFPENSFIKDVRLVKDQGNWRLVFAVEYDKRKVEPISHGNEVIYFYPRWTQEMCPDGEKRDLIIGDLVRRKKIGKEWVPFKEEVRLFTSLAAIRGKEPKGRKGNKEFLLSMVDYMECEQSRADQLLDGVKRELRELGGIEETLGKKGWKRDLVYVTADDLSIGVWMLRDRLPESMIDDLMRRLTRSRMLSEKSINMGKRIRRARDWCYWNFANWLCDQAKEIVIEKLPLKGLGKKNDVKDKVRKHKNIVAIGGLVQKIKQKGDDRGVTVIEVKKDKKEEEEEEREVGEEMVRGKERCILDELTQKILLEHFEDYEGQLKPADYELEVVKLENL